MDVSVMLEPIEGTGFRATALVPTPVVAEAPTRDEAMERLRALIGEKLSRAELVGIELPPGAGLHPWLAIAGSWRDHPDLEDVEEAIRTYRRELEADGDRP